MTRRVERKTELGAALVVALLALTLIAAVGASLTLTSTGEAMVAGDFARIQEARYAAEAGMERAMTDLRAFDDWASLPGDDAMSGFTDGPAAGIRQLPAGGTLDLGRVVNLANCGKVTACASIPVWRLFAYAPLAVLLPAGAIRSSVYVVVLLADGPSATCADGNAQPECSSGKQSLALRAEAFSARGAHQIVQAVVERPSTPGALLGVRTEQMIGVR